MSLQYSEGERYCRRFFRTLAFFKNGNPEKRSSGAKNACTGRKRMKRTCRSEETSIREGETTEIIVGGPFLGLYAKIIFCFLVSKKWADGDQKEFFF